MELLDKAATVSINKYGSPYVGTTVNSLSLFVVSSTKVNGFSPPKVSITLSPLVLLTFSSSVNLVPVGIYKGYIISSIVLVVSVSLFMI